MDAEIRSALDQLGTDDRGAHDEAYATLMASTDQPVDWAYEVWDELIGLLSHPGNRQRSIASQVLCNLAKSDPDSRMLTILDALLEVTRDERFVTARHCMQSLWKVGVAGEAQRVALLDGLERRFHECTAEKNCTLIRYDIIQSLERIYAGTQDERVREKAHEWIAFEEDAKYRKKYAGVWRGK